MVPTKEKIIIYTDGAARGNPGLAGAGAVITDSAGNVVHRASKYLGHQTNNYAEYQAVILGLETLKKKVGKTKLHDYEIEIRLDSELVARQLSGKYEINEPTLFPFFIKISNMQVKDFPKLTFTHVPREENKGADEMANLAVDSGISQNI